MFASYPRLALQPPRELTAKMQLTYREARLPDLWRDAHGDEPVQACVASGRIACATCLTGVWRQTAPSRADPLNGPFIRV